MQRVKAHELREKDEKALIEELTKFRVRHKTTNLCRKNWPSLE